MKKGGDDTTFKKEPFFPYALQEAAPFTTKFCKECKARLIVTFSD